MFCSLNGWSQNITQTLRGSITDFDTKVPLIGANVIVVNTNPIQGVLTDINGEFSIDREKASHSFKIDIQNVTNNQARISQYYSSSKNAIAYNKQLSLVPNLIYTIKF